uniref:Uncharacterized protein n=1 Tax=Neogobius melanostomus TaxID=47308 RepID=A0A8C6S8B7_9GOBI
SSSVKTQTESHGHMYLSCPICQEVFKEPVFLSCHHSFCKDCLMKPTLECPVCKTRSSRSDPPRNLALRNLCEAFVLQREQKTPKEQVCRVHSERLKLFCVTDQQPVCVVCRDSKVHEDHRCRPIDEAAQDLRDELDKSLLPLKENLQKAKDLKEKFEGKACSIKKQALYTEKQIEKQFLKLHIFLSEQQELRMKALREEEEQKTQRMKDKMAAVSREIEALSESIRATEEQLRAPDVSFLLKYKAAVERVQRCPLLEEEPQLGQEALIDQAKHLGNLTFDIWTNMKKLAEFTPVILDPITANNAVLSDDLTSFTRVQKQAVKEGMTVVSGSEGFDSGFHSWSVELGNNSMWELGVTTDPTGKPEDVKFWVLSFLNGKYSADTSKRSIFLNLDLHPLKITVCLDSDEHKVSFYELDSFTHIHSFTNLTQKKLFPCFVTASKSPVKILPLNIVLANI